MKYQQKMKISTIQNTSHSKTKMEQQNKHKQSYRTTQTLEMQSIHRWSTKQIYIQIKNHIHT